jgi:hypothetical protein
LVTDPFASPAYPTEVNDAAVATTLSRYGEVTSITEEFWTSKYRYKVPTGARYVISLKAHIPSQIRVAGYKTLTQYDGQKITCYVCQECGHTTPNCSYKWEEHPRLTETPRRGQEGTWANIVRHGRPQIPHQTSTPSDTVKCAIQSTEHTSVPTRPTHTARGTDEMFTTDVLQTVPHRHHSNRNNLRNSCNPVSLQKTTTQRLRRQTQNSLRPPH